MSNDQRPSPSAEGHHGEMSSPSKCDAIFAANRSTRITNTEFRVLACILDGLCKRADIAKAANVSVPTVARAIAKLVSLEWVIRVEAKGKPSQLTADVTRITKDTRIVGDTALAKTKITRDTTTRVTDARRITDEPTSRIVGDTGSVDNYVQRIEHVPARVEDNLFLSKKLEIYPERVELAVTVPAKVLNGSAKGLPAQQLAEVLADHANNPFLDPSKYDGLRTTCGRIHRWITAGADFDADILPTVVRIMAKASKPVRSWGYFEDAVREATATRLASEAPMEIITPSEAMNDQRNRYPSDEGTYTRRKRSRHIDALFADESDGPPKHLGRLDFSAGK